MKTVSLPVLVEIKNKGGTMKFGYARVSTPKQSLESQLKLLQDDGCEKIFCDVISGAMKDKPEFEKLFNQLRPGDSLTVTGIDRLGRSTKDLSNLLEYLHTQKVDLIVLGHDIDTRTPTGRMIFNLMALLAENERLRNLERIHQGIQARKSRGLNVGRPKKLNLKQIQRLKELYETNSLSRQELCLMYNIKHAAFYRYLKLAHSG